MVGVYVVPDPGNMILNFEMLVVGTLHDDWEKLKTFKTKHNVKKLHLGKRMRLKNLWAIFSFRFDVKIRVAWKLNAQLQKLVAIAVLKPEFEIESDQSWNILEPSEVLV